MKLPVAGFILAGGKSTRMGRDKAMVEVAGAPMIVHALAVLQKVCAEVTVVGGVVELRQFARLVEDETPGCGPLGGIVAALKQTTFDWNLFHAVDAPYVPEEVWRSLTQRALACTGVAVMARVRGRVHPLCAAYHRGAAAGLGRELDAGRWKVTRAVEATGPVEYVDFEEAHWFRNLNSPEDLASATMGDNQEAMAQPDDNAEQPKPEIGPDTPLIADVSPDVAPAVEEFMEQAAAQNEAAAEAASDEKTETKPFIAFQDVSKSFGNFTVLKRMNFFVNSGETLCILGRSGVGKSVSLQMLMGFLKPDSGSVLVAGDDITGFTEKQLQEVRKKVTMVFQNGALFDSITIGENVAFPLRERGDMEEDQIFKVVKGLLEMVGVAGMDHLLPSDLSTGMKRSVAIARALATQPEAVLYDEPTTMVDPLMAHLLGDLIQRLKQQLHLTSIVVTHDMRFAKRLADRVVFLDGGEARFFGTMDEMERSNDKMLKDFLRLDALVLPE